MVGTSYLSSNLNMKHNIFAIIIGAFCIISCTFRENNNINECSDGIVSLLISENPDYKPHTVYEAIDGDYNRYLDYFVGTDYEIGISSSKDGGLPGGSTISCISGISQVRKTEATKGSGNALPPIKSFVDGLEISRQNVLSTKASGGILDCFGKTVKFSFNNCCETKSSENNSGVVDMYVPKAIEFISPHAETEEDLNPLCYYKDFVIKWNIDENNENGVLVVIDWNGSMVLGKDIPGTHVCRIASFPDIGEARLSEEMFDGIPDTAHCDLLILRGNIDNVEQGQFTYKLIGKTHHLISFILIREIDTL